jgi:hypothetical protein
MSHHITKSQEIIWWGKKIAKLLQRNDWKQSTLETLQENIYKTFVYIYIIHIKAVRVKCTNICLHKTNGIMALIIVASSKCSDA